MPSIELTTSGLLTTIQDSGRKGQEHWGIMVGGWMDDYASCWANRLVGNGSDSAVLEMTLLGPDFTSEEEGWFAWTGANFAVTVNGHPWPSGTARLISSGSLVHFGSCTEGVRAYLAAAGGFVGERLYGSASTDLVAGFGGSRGRPLRSGDVVAYRGGDAGPWRAPVDTMIRSDQVRILPGARLDRMASDAWSRLVQNRYRVSPRSDRVGIRLTGPALSDAPQVGNGISEGMTIGAIQAPPSGELLLLAKSRGSIGGYPTIAHVITADWPIMAQLRPGQEIQLVPVDLETASLALAERRRAMELALMTNKCT